MSTILQRNAIIAGYINSCCLVCERFFETVDETISHIVSDEHTSCLPSYPHLEKYGNNCIRKVKAGYFCEFCSQLIATAPKVNLHISEKSHYCNKGIALLRQSGPALTAFNDVIIHDNAWHTFSEDACGLCNQEFDDENEHKIERTHLLKLIQNKVELADNNSLYRKIDKNDFQCLTCNSVLPLSGLDEHFNSDDHNQTYVQCQLEKNKFDEQNRDLVEKFQEEQIEFLRQVISLKKNSKAVEHKDIEIIHGNGEDENNFHKTDKHNQNSLQSNSEINVSEKLHPKTDAENCSLITKDIKTQKKQDPQLKTENVPKKNTGTIPKDTKKPENIEQEKKTEPIETKDETSVFANSHNLTYSAGNSSAFCKLCAKKFPSSIRNMKEHVAGREHVNKAAKAAQAQPVLKKKAKLQKKEMESFVTQACTFNNMVDNDTVINESFCITEKSCHMITKTGSRYRCQICEVYLYDEEDIEEHASSAKHEKGFRQTNIVLNLGKEFVREVRPEVYHCGYCNLLISGWSDMDAHLKNSADHKTNIATCERRLRIYLPAIAASLDEQAREAIFAMFVNHMRTN